VVVLSQPLSRGTIVGGVLIAAAVVVLQGPWNAEAVRTPG